MIGIGTEGRVRELLADAMVPGSARQLLPAVAEQARTDAPRGVGRPGRVDQLRQRLAYDGMVLPAELLEDRGLSLWIERAVDRSLTYAAVDSDGLRMWDFWSLQCRYPECQCDRDVPCGVAA